MGEISQWGKCFNRKNVICLCNGGHVGIGTVGGGNDEVSFMWARAKALWGCQWVATWASTDKICLTLPSAESTMIVRGVTSSRVVEIIKK